MIARGEGAGPGDLRHARHADAPQADALKDAGLDYYNHNLDTSPEYYRQIITTRTYQDRLDTLARVREAGMQRLLRRHRRHGRDAATTAPAAARRWPPCPSIPRACRSTSWCRSRARRSARCARRSTRSSSCARSRSRACSCRRRMVRLSAGRERDERRAAGAVLPRRRQLDLLRREAADHRQSRTWRRTARCSRGWDLRAAARGRCRGRGRALRRAARSRARGTRQRRRTGRALLRDARAGSTARAASTGGSCVNFCSNDYLGLAPIRRRRAPRRVRCSRFGFGAGASHLVTGHCARAPRARGGTGGLRRPRARTAVLQRLHGEPRGIALRSPAARPVLPTA